MQEQQPGLNSLVVDLDAERKQKAASNRRTVLLSGRSRAQRRKLENRSRNSEAVESHNRMQANRSAAFRKKKAQAKATHRMKVKARRLANA